MWTVCLGQLRQSEMDEKMRECGFHSNTVDSVMKHTKIRSALEAILERPSNVVRNLGCKLEVGLISQNILLVCYLLFRLTGPSRICCNRGWHRTPCIGTIIWAYLMVLWLHVRCAFDM